MPWYNAIKDALKPIEADMSLLLVGIAGITLLLAWKGDAVTKTAWFVYLISP